MCQRGRIADVHGCGHGDEMATARNNCQICESVEFGTVESVEPGHIFLT